MYSSNMITQFVLFWSLRIDKIYHCQNYKRVVQLIEPFPTKKKSTYCLYCRKSALEPRNVIFVDWSVLIVSWDTPFLLGIRNRILIETCNNPKFFSLYCLLALFLLNYSKDSLTLLAWNQVSRSVVRKF